jgi:15-cis-phytoene desaturase
MTEHADVVVVGGGLAGLSAAFALAEGGLVVVVLERAERLGGRASGSVDPISGCPIDTGPHVFLPSYRTVLGLLRGIGAHNRVRFGVEPAIRLVLADGHVVTPSRLLPASASLLPALVRDRALSAVDVVSNGAAALLGRLAGEAGFLFADRFTGADLLGALGVTATSRRRLWDPLARAMLGCGLDACSGGSLLRFCALAMRHGHMPMGVADCNLTELFGPGIAARVRAAGGSVRTRQEVTGIRPRSTGSWRIESNEATIDARAVIVATPPDAANRLLAGAGIAIPDLEPVDYVSVMLWLDRRVSSSPTVFTRIGEPPLLKRDVFVLSHLGSLIGANHAFAASPPDDDAGLVRRTLADLEAVVPCARGAVVVRHHLTHTRGASFRQLPGFERGRPAQRTPARGLYLAGDWTATDAPPSMESAARSGALAAAALVRDRAGGGFGVSDIVAYPLAARH